MLKGMLMKLNGNNNEIKTPLFILSQNPEVAAIFDTMETLGEEAKTELTAVKNAFEAKNDKLWEDVRVLLTTQGHIVATNDKPSLSVEDGVMFVTEENSKEDSKEDNTETNVETNTETTGLDESAVNAPVDNTVH